MLYNKMFAKSMVYHHCFFVFKKTVEEVRHFQVIRDYLRRI